MAQITNSVINISKAQNIDSVKTGISLLLNAASAPFGVAANNYGRFDIGESTYDTTPFWSIGNIPVAMLDFRASIGKLKTLSANVSMDGVTTGANGLKLNVTGLIPTFRLDGTAAALNGSKTARKYAALSATTGPYIVFGRSAPGKNGKGWGDHGSPTAPRLDFTARSNVNTTWDPDNKKWIPTTKITDLITPFRGDKVSVIDYKKSTTLNDAYRWKPKSQLEEALGKVIKNNDSGLTSDFIKFYFTGPSILSKGQQADDIIVFRAAISSIQESYTAGWSPVQMIGRADPNYHYSSFGRDLSVDFTVYATDRDEMKPIYRKLNAIAGYTAPTYSTNTIGLTGPWMRMTIGDLFTQQPVILTSLTYNLTDSDTTWEINIEDDPEMMQAPHRVTVSMQLTVISDWLPEKGGRFYSLAKQFDDNGAPKKGNDNWLSDAYSTDEAKKIAERDELIKRVNEYLKNPTVDELNN